MKVGRIVIGKGVTVGAFTTVLYDTNVGDYARLGNLSLIMKGENIPADTRWAGAPAQPAAAPAISHASAHADVTIAVPADMRPVHAA